ncbi:hypothetical protein NP233_g7332 [Leucocoprinus birnbaumii]|uniref:FAD/NAD(P)-binding domain-containing protein n=1 Tax=Leucocoprinus birnbaumii TaxID=56174 RepID=A0AAD5VQD4_9AGAR|nr:hypothetical protein NP233_g7332 [Leucocoprinus birnbaumii]
MTTHSQVPHSRLKRMSMPASVSTSAPSSPAFNPFYARWSNAPLPGESEEQAAARVKLFQEAVKRSKEIDESLQETKKVLERRKKAVKILLLGQSESGKSSVLKNFQLAFAPRHFEANRQTWKLILKQVSCSNIRTIIETLSAEWEPSTPTSPGELNSAVRNFRRIRLSLSPLFIIENNLLKMLAPETKDPTSDVCVRAGSGWKALLQAHRTGQSSPSSPLETGGHHQFAGGPSMNFGKRQSNNSLSHESDPSQAMIAQKEEIMWLWRDPEVRRALRKRGIHLEETAGFFMSDAERIASPNYIPTDSDIIRARLRTVGVEEHHFTVEKGGDTGSDVYITDVGGSRSQRASWVPYFDDVQAILFLAPLAFNLTLEEDPRVNRLEDSLNLWREICQKPRSFGYGNHASSMKDVLASTLASGIQVNRYVPSYGDLPNEITEVTKYFKDKFKSYHKRLSPTARPFMCYETSAIDIKSMTVLLIGVRESILRQHLKNESGSRNNMSSTKTVVVLGGAYGGAHAAQILAAGIPDGWRIILIDRNSHANHVYVMPRFAVLPDHEYKAFIPFSRVFLKDPETIPHLHLQAHIISLTQNTVTLNKSFPEHGFHSTTINFDYAIYALGSHLPSPLDLWGTSADPEDKKSPRYRGEKSEGSEWLRAKQQLIEKAPTVLVVGGGALGIQFATDIAAIYPNKKVTLLHSRDRLLPRFDEAMHYEVLRSLKDADIDVILGERLDLDSVKNDEGSANVTTGRKVVRTVKGREIEADLLVRKIFAIEISSRLTTFDPSTINPANSLVHVLRTLQVGVLQSTPSLDEKSTAEDSVADTTPYSNLFAIGDAADAFGAIAAGAQRGEVAARNIIRLIKRSESSPSDEKAQYTHEPLELYTPRAPAIKVSLGLTKSVFQSAGVVDTRNDGVPDLQAASIWPFWGITPTKDEDMLP